MHDQASTSPARTRLTRSRPERIIANSRQDARPIVHVPHQDTLLDSREYHDALPTHEPATDIVAAPPPSLAVFLLSPANSEALRYFTDLQTTAAKVSDLQTTVSVLQAKNANLQKNWDDIAQQFEPERRGDEALIKTVKRFIVDVYLGD